MILKPSESFNDPLSDFYQHWLALSKDSAAQTNEPATKKMKASMRKNHWKHLVTSIHHRRLRHQP